MLSMYHFIAEPVTVEFSSPPTFTKKPHCPQGFTWHEEYLSIKKCLAEWKDYSRRGRMARNMQPQHANIATKKGSWGVGRFYFDVETEGEKFYRLYYDRTPKDADDRRGQWVLLGELKKE